MQSSLSVRDRAERYSLPDGDTLDFLIGAPRFARGAAMIGQREDSQNTHLVVQRERDDTADPDWFTWLNYALAIDAGHALTDNRLRQRAALHQADAVEVAIDPQC